MRGTVNGTPIRSRPAVYGGVTVLGRRREIREAAGIELGDVVDVVLDLDDEPREVELPAELDAAPTADARELFDALSFTHRREYAEWIGEAKRPETRAAPLERSRAARGRPPSSTARQRAARQRIVPVLHVWIVVPLARSDVRS